MKISPFQKKVYQALSLVPKGKVTTYKILSNYLMSHPRAVGQALKDNPYAPKVPCHRVIKTDLTLGGYKGETKGGPLRKKKKLLSQEGVLFQRDVLLDTKNIFYFELS